MKKISKGEILLVQPPFELSKEFVDYPWLDILSTLQAAAVLESSGWNPRILNGLSGPGAKFELQGKTAWMGIDKASFLGELDYINESVIMLHSGPWFAYSPSRRWLLEIIGRLKNRTNSRIVVAELHQEGMHYVESDPTELLRAGADIVQRYEGENFCYGFERILKDHEKHGKWLYEEHSAISLDALARPAWQMVNIEEYFKFCDEVLDSNWRHGPYGSGYRTLPLVTSRGCPYNCIFCSHGPGLNAFDRALLRTIPLKTVADWLSGWKDKFDLQRVVVLDDVANLDRTRFSRFLDIVLELDLKVEFPNGLRADRLEQQHIEKLSRITSMLKVSLESAVDRVQKQLLGKNLDPLSVRKTAISCRKYNLPMEVHGIIGVPGESRDEIMETLRFVDNLNEEFGVNPRIQFANPLAGTRLHKVCSDSDFLPDHEPDVSSGFSVEPIICTEQIEKSFLMDAKASLSKKINASEYKKVIVNLTYRCNNRCKFCATGDRNPVDAELSHVLERISWFVANGYELLDVDGGEPTLHPGLITLLKQAKSKGFKEVSVITNGRRASYMKFARTLVNTGVDEVLVSLHSADKTIQESITKVAGSFHQTTVGIENLMEAFGDADSVVINTTMIKENIRSLVSMPPKLLAMGVKRWNLQLVTPFGRAYEEQVPSKKQVSSTISNILREYGNRLSIRVINIPPCALPGYERLASADFEKANRHMVFVGQKGQNLQSYLSSRRKHVDKCKSCPFSLLCPGEYFF